MRTTSLRSLHLDGPGEFLVQVTLNKEVVGTFVPVGVASPESIEWALVGSPPVARTERIIAAVNSAGPDRISVVTALEEIGVDLDGVQPHIPGTDYYDGRDGDIEAEPVVRKRKVLGEVAVAAPLAKHTNEDELQAARAARNKALDDALKARQKLAQDILNKMPSTGRGGHR